MLCVIMKNYTTPFYMLYVIIFVYTALYSENCNKYYNAKYFENHIKIRIVNIPNNKYDTGNLYFEMLEIFKLNKVDMIIEYLDKAYLIDYENDIKKFFKIL